MSRTAYPTDRDLQILLTASGAISTPMGSPENLFDLTAEMAAAVSDWEQATGLSPFLMDANDVTVYYDPPGQHDGRGIFGMQRGGGRMLYLPSQNGSVFASVTSVTVGYSSSFAGTLLVANQDYWLEPKNAPLRSRPYEWIDFGARQFGSLWSVVVVGKRGWPVVPDNAWSAVLHRAGARVLRQAAVLAGGGAISEKHGDDQWQYGDKGPYAAQIDAWDGVFLETVRDFVQAVV